MSNKELNHNFQLDPLLWDLNLRIPGPTPCPPQVLKAMSHPMVNHRSANYFIPLARSISQDLQIFFKTKNEVMVPTSSGTGGMEAAVVNLLSPGDKVLGVSMGYFGDRLARIAKAFGADVRLMQVEWGKAADPDSIKKELKKYSSIKAVLITHNETSTGVTNDLKAVAKVAKGFDKLLIVDAVSSIPGIDMEMDKWGIDSVCTASQKGWMTPPGLAFVALSKTGWKAYKTSKMSKYYFNLGRFIDYENPGNIPQTPAVSLYFALNVALKVLKKEGHDNLIARHKKLAKKVRDGAKNMGLELVADEAHASDTVTAIYIPEKIGAGHVIRELEKRKVVVAGGMGALAGKIIRIGHMGYVNDKEIDETLKTLEESIKNFS
ncbi:alanine--glyoxylate aminotransferase family protein [Candidatus Daviesbacteria bacterium]|nr:alanine--glyoxylate aminotransferase family protein [Candidatus Daviesbacteria bacterium]